MGDDSPKVFIWVEKTQRYLVKDRKEKSLKKLSIVSNVIEQSSKIGCITIYWL